MKELALKKVNNKTLNLVIAVLFSAFIISSIFINTFVFAFISITAFGIFAIRSNLS